MFSYEDRKRAVELYIKYGYKATTVVRELGYPKQTQSLVQWYKEFNGAGDLKKKSVRKSKFSKEQIEHAVNYYMEHGKNYTVTINAIGYPSRGMLRCWVHRLYPNEPVRHGNYRSEKYLKKEKEAIAIELLTRDGSAKEIAEKYDVSRYTLYNWKWELLDKDLKRFMPKYKQPITDNAVADELIQEVENLRSEANKLSQEVYKLQIEKDVLEKAVELIKKDPGVNLDNLSNKEKTLLVDALRNKYSLKELLELLKIAKSSYCYQESLLNDPDKYGNLKIEVVKIFKDSNETYGYRRIHSEIKKQGIIISEKVIRRVMKDMGLIARKPKRRHYNSYKGEISPAVPNVINRDFHAQNPNEKWLTDITEFSIPAGKVYLSPIIDCFDGLPVSWSIGTSPNAELANGMLDSAIATLINGEKPIVHTDRGCHYRWPGWISRMDAAGLIRSMSNKGCSPDNSACEGFFGRLKNEMFYGRDWSNVTINQFIEKLNKYIVWYGEKRIKLSLGGLSPMEYRRSLGLV